MLLFVLTAASGWSAAILLGANVALPYILRSMRGMPRAACLRFRLHYVLGFIIPALASLHAWLPMSRGTMRASDLTGLLLATVALFILLAQAGLGIVLRAARGAGRNRTRSRHFWAMTVILCLVAAHIALNRA
jgi:hypothetical protein